MDLSIDDIKILHAILKSVLEGDDALFLRLRKDEMNRAADMIVDFECELEEVASEEEAEESWEEYEEDEEDEESDGEVGGIDW